MNKLRSLAFFYLFISKHGEAFFPVQKYITKLNSDYPVVTTHWHEEAEFTLVTKGSCLYQINLADYEVNAGDLLLIPPLFSYNPEYKMSLVAARRQQHWYILCHAPAIPCLI